MAGSDQSKWKLLEIMLKVSTVTFLLDLKTARMSSHLVLNNARSYFHVLGGPKLKSEEKYQHDKII